MNWESLSEEQRSAATYAGRHLLVRGFAGTGKTTVLAARAAHLLNAGVPPEKILILCPTEAGCAAIIQQTRELSQDKGAERLSARTFQDWCQQLLDRYPKVFGIEGFRRTGSEEVTNFVPRGIERVGMFPFDRVIPRIYARYIFARTSLEDAIYWVYFSKNGYEEGATKAKRYHPEIKQGFDDYIDFKVVNKQYDEIDVQNIIAVTLQNSPAVQQMIAAEQAYILVDDVQDVAPLQYEILRSLAPDCNLFCVGDETLATWCSLGADWTNLKRISEFIPDIEERVLTKNFRCSQEIQDLALWVLRQSPNGYRIEVPQARSAGQIPQLFCSEEKYNLYDAIADDIKQNVARYGYRYEDHLLLARDSGDLYGPRISLTKRGIPCPGPEQIRQKKYQSDHARQLLIPMLQFVDTDARPHKTLAGIRKRFEAKHTPDSYIYKESIQKEYDELLGLAAQAKDVRHFFQLVEENSIQIKNTGYKNDNNIRVETIQAAKTHEAEIVYLWGLDHLHWPKLDERRNPDLKEECRRLLSLGITRARSKVVLLCPDHKAYLKKSKKIPFFLQEIGPMVEIIDSFEERK